MFLGIMSRLALPVYAVFLPRAERGGRILQQQLSQAPPLVVLTLAHAFPYLLLLDHALATATWTNDDHWANFLALLVFAAVCLYWETINPYLFPVFLLVSFAASVWWVQLIVIDLRTAETPTMDEMVSVVENIVARFEFLVAPLQWLAALPRHHFRRAVVLLVVLTPAHVVLWRYWFPPRYYLLALVITVLTFHSTEATACRRLLWRSRYVRTFVAYTTGYSLASSTVDIHQEVRRGGPEEQGTVAALVAASGTAATGVAPSLAPTAALTTAPPAPSNGPMSAKRAFKILNRSNILFGTEGQLVEFSVLEHQRRWFGVGWSGYLLPYERLPYTTENLVECHSPTEFVFPAFNADRAGYQWRWFDKEWRVDTEFNHLKVDVEGWCYYDHYWQYAEAEDGVLKYTRTRKWSRRAMLLVEKEPVLA